MDDRTQRRDQPLVPPWKTQEKSKRSPYTWFQRQSVRCHSIDQVRALPSRDPSTKNNNKRHREHPANNRSTHPRICPSIHGSPQFAATNGGWGQTNISALPNFVSTELSQNLKLVRSANFGSAKFRFGDPLQILRFENLIHHFQGGIWISNPNIWNNPRAPSRYRSNVSILSADRCHAYDWRAKRRQTDSSR
jgi:hypothetical protein